MKKLIFGALAALAFASCGNNQTAQQNTTNDSIAIAQGVIDSLTKLDAIYDIAVVDVDYVVANYNMFIEENAKLEKKAEKVNNDLTARGRKLEKEYLDFEEKRQNGLATQAKLAEMAASLQKKGEQYDADRASKAEELQEEHAVMMNNVAYAIENFIKGYNADGRYKMILTRTAVIDADASMDITQIILDGLNAQYAAQKNNAQ